MDMLSAHQTLRRAHCFQDRSPAAAVGAGAGPLLYRCSTTRKALGLELGGRQWKSSRMAKLSFSRNSFRLMARKKAGGGPSNNMDEYTEEELDNLLEEYGEVVFTNPYQRPSSSEANDDAESLSFAVALAKAADDIKAVNIRVLCVKRLVYWTSYFIIATAFSNPQIDAIGSKMRYVAEQKFKKFSVGDLKPNSWTLLDFGDVVVHLFLPQQRDFYNLEEFYGNATLVELPFKTQVTHQE